MVTALTAVLLMLGSFALGTIFGWSVKTLRRPWVRPLSDAARLKSRMPN